MSHLEPPPEEKEPFWNDSDKMGGMAASITLIALAIFVACVVIAAGLGIVKLVL